MLSGGNEAYFLANNATEPITIPDINFVLPVDNGFFWTLQLKNDGQWGAYYYECLGNKIDEIYAFDSSLGAKELGPKGLEGELLLITQQNNMRMLSCIGNNGRMFWRINLPERVCPRDLALTNNENLILLLKKGENIWLTRFIIDFAEG